MKSLRVIFMGTPEFAVSSLDAIYTGSSHRIVGVVTVPDKPSGRGQKISESPVKQYTVQHKIPILQPEKLKDPLFLQQLQQWEADIFVVVAFRMLPVEVWKMPSLGTINLHGSLLPQYRGAAPINRAIMNGELETGVTTFFINESIDTGNILFSEKIPIGKDENAGMLHDKMKIIGAQLVVKTLDAISENHIVPLSQDRISMSTQILKLAPKIYPDDCKIDWNASTLHIFNQIRGLSPYPAAFTTLQHENGTIRTLKIFRANIAGKQNMDTARGFFVDNHKKRLFFLANDGWIEVIEVQIDGKKRMKTDEFLRGFDISDYRVV